MDRLTKRLPTHLGAVIITVGGLFSGIALASLVVRGADLQGGGALLLQLAIVAGLTTAVWVALPDRFFSPWEGFYSGNAVEPWESPTDKRRREEREAEEEASGRRAAPGHDRPAGDPDDPRDPEDPGPR